MRAAGAAAALGVALVEQDALPLVLGPLALAAWLSTGICTPILAPGGVADATEGG